jgi:preprotein translocase subunit SecE
MGRRSPRERPDKGLLKEERTRAKMAQAVSKREPAAVGALESAKAWPLRVKEYFQELQAEMRRVTWPSWKQVRATTFVVLVTVFLFSAYFWVVDQIMGQTITRIFNAFTAK